MSIWIKICGLTTAAAVSAAADAGAHAIGFVFAPSKRQVTPEIARTLSESVPKHIARVAVMQHPAQAWVDEVLSVFKPDVLQTDAEDLATLRLPLALEITPVIRSGQALPATLPSRLLFEGPVSGTGQLADWTHAAQLSDRTQLILAGGLNAANVAAAIARVRPFGVDVSSGVESAPGLKDLQKIHEFVRAARATDAAPAQIIRRTR
jgi:phosphoribosylanthranilate isomerase